MYFVMHADLDELLNYLGIEPIPDALPPDLTPPS
jgi:hypothetical protein